MLLSAGVRSDYPSEAWCELQVRMKAKTQGPPVVLCPVSGQAGRGQGEGTTSSIEIREFVIREGIVMNMKTFALDSFCPLDLNVYFFLLILQRN